MSTITFTLIQTTLHWEDTPRNLQMLEQKIKRIKDKTQVIILPEMFSTGFSMKPKVLAETMDGETVAWMKRIAREKRVIVTGSVMISEVTEHNHTAYYNRMIWMQPDGNYGYYNKRHLFAYAEEDKHYTAGRERVITSVNGWRINLQVCYDLRFPVWARQTSPPAPLQQVGEGSSGGSAFEYDVLIYVANWPERRSTAWKALLQARAIENQCYVIGVNRVGDDGNNIYHSGDSMVIDPLGEILYHKKDAEDIFTITLNKKNLEEVRERFQFWRDGDAFQIMG